MSWIINHYIDVFAVLGMAVTLATAVTKLTPTKKDDEIVSKIRKVIEFISMNMLKK